VLHHYIFDFTFQVEPLEMTAVRDPPSRGQSSDCVTRVYTRDPSFLRVVGHELKCSSFVYLFKSAAQVEALTPEASTNPRLGGTVRWCRQGVSRSYELFQSRSLSSRGPLPHLETPLVRGIGWRLESCDSHRLAIGAPMAQLVSIRTI